MRNHIGTRYFGTGCVNMKGRLHSVWLSVNANLRVSDIFGIRINSDFEVRFGISFGFRCPLV